ncbi:MAG TPA: F0F1 ATP synthase subunit gamma [Burkholderiaceae bacterium]|nr:F0F1 ATP synthase subunit gamma [Burkholderiaceae bacterium]
MSGVALRERLVLLDELRQIVTAMRNLAYAELQRLNRMQAACARADETIERALADTVPAVGAPPPRATGTVWLVIGSERGFCGGFNDQLADALAGLVEREADAQWMIAGTRLRQRLEPVLHHAAWLDGCTGTEDAPACVDTWMSRLASSAPAGPAPTPSLWLLHHAEHGVARRRMLPLPDLPAPSAGPPPARYLPRAQLLPKLMAEMLRVALLGALLQSLQQENHWRLAQMQRAQDYLDEAGGRLRRRYFRQRQSDITSELETLMASLDATGMKPPVRAALSPASRHSARTAS